MAFECGQDATLKKKSILQIKQKKNFSEIFFLAGGGGRLGI